MNATKVTYKGFRDEDQELWVSDSDDEDTKADTWLTFDREPEEIYIGLDCVMHLPDDAFNFVRNYIEECSGRIERQLRGLRERAYEKKQKRKVLKRRLVVLGDEEAITPTFTVCLKKKKLFIFCSVMGRQNPLSQLPPWVTMLGV
ncbi:hypothetical protein Slin15195_G037060 [Septoria linicola]|uniref:Uncharacterized protein n=1 Tax=Septoria linicola TaxID=215465 RepID=A0A9Q9EHW4_9PEZI|nr:hypothetical protein Slin15195_G037060 [Septoria linicola]